MEALLGAAVDSLYRRLSRPGPTRLPWAVIQIFSRAQGSLLAGSMAYYTFLSLLPLLMVASFVVGVFSSSSAAAQRNLADAINRLLPGQGSQILDQLIDARVAFGVVGFVAVVYAGSGFVGAMTACLNRMWNVPAGRNPLSQKVVNLTAVFLLGLVLLGSAAATLWVRYVAEEIFGSRASPWLRVVELVATPAAIFVLLLVLYRVLPARRLTVRSQIPGAAFGALGAELLKRGFSLWADHSAGISALPRTLLSSVLLLLWLGFFGQLMLYGAALNVALYRKREGLPLVTGEEDARARTFASPPVG